MFAAIPEQLLLTVIGNLVSVVVLVVVGLFVYIQAPRALINRLFLFLSLSLGTYAFLIAGAALQTTYESAYLWSFFTVLNVFIVMASVHLLLVTIDRDDEWRWFIRASYLIGFAILATALYQPAWFMEGVSPRGYFTYYRDVGWLYNVMMVYFVSFPLVALGRLFVEFFSVEGERRVRYGYYGFSFVLGFGLGLINYLFAIGVPVDPFFASLIGLSFIPMAYGIFAHRLLDVHIALVRAVYGAVAIGAIAAFFVFLIFANDFLERALPGLQFWMIPLLAATVAVVTSRLVWSQTQNADRLKYEFITIAAHKLRTPLTRIRWEVPTLLQRAGDDPVLKEGILRIDVANNRLIELTNILMEAAHTEDTAYGYKKEPIDLAVAIKNALGRFDTTIKEKNLSIVTSLDPAIKKPVGDPGRIASVVDVMIENAVMYNKNGGSVRIAVTQESAGRIRFTVSDTGIGVPEDDQGRIFSSFYRSDAAKRTDTEGVGIGLSIAKNIIQKHGGRMGFESVGNNKGATFWFTLPV
jgi:signal transduction histidine kinase